MIVYLAKIQVGRCWTLPAIVVLQNPNPNPNPHHHNNKLTQLHRKRKKKISKHQIPINLMEETLDDWPSNQCSHQQNPISLKNLCLDGNCYRPNWPQRRNLRRMYTPILWHIIRHYAIGLYSPLNDPNDFTTLCLSWQDNDSMCKRQFTWDLINRNLEWFLRVNFCADNSGRGGTTTQYRMMKFKAGYANGTLGGEDERDVFIFKCKFKQWYKLNWWWPAGTINQYSPVHQQLYHEKTYLMLK